MREGTPRPARTQNLTVRITPGDKGLIEQAATIVNEDITTFLLATALIRARTILERPRSADGDAPQWSPVRSTIARAASVEASISNRRAKGSNHDRRDKTIIAAIERSRMRA